MDKKRIMICGASGTGKTTLAKFISGTYDIPYISTSASKLWPKYGFKNHEDVLYKCGKDKSLSLAYQVDVLNTRINEVKDKDTFVTDRSYIDNLTYLLLDMGYKIRPGEFGAFVDIVKKRLEDIDLIIYIRYSDDIPLENDGKRIVNSLYQKLTDQVMHWILYSPDFMVSWNTKVIELNIWDFEVRIRKVKSWIDRL